MLILGLDTSTDYAVGALADETGRLEHGAAFRHDRSLSTRLYPMIEAMFTESGHAFEDVGAFAVGIGPGSFTGIRIAVTTMRTLAQVTGRPLVAISTLELIAAGAACAPGSTICALLHSRANEVYAATYRDGKIEGEAIAASYAGARLLVADKIVGSRALLQAIYFDRDLSDPTFIFGDVPTPDALASLAGRELRLARFRDPLALDPMYVVPPAVSQHKTAKIGP